MISFLPRKSLMDSIRDSIRKNPVTALLGPRQAGKSTLARLFADNPENRFDLENPIDLARLEPDSYGILANMEGVVVIDEIQQIPEIFAQLRVIVDNPMCKSRFLVTGSASPTLMTKTAESLAGRVGLIEMTGFDLRETGISQWESLWFRGGFPRSFLADSDQDSRDWLEDFLKTYVMRDIQTLAGGRLTPQTLARFLLMMAHYHGQSWNQREVTSALGIDVKTVQKYLDVFEGAYLIRRLMPYERNVGKRLRKMPRMYFRDTGILHRLLRINNITSLRTHDRLGASWEGFAMEQIARYFDLGDNCFYWRTHAGAEIDMVFQGAETYGFEFKASTNPSVTRGTYEAMADLDISQLYVIYPGDKEFQLSETVRVVPVTNLSNLGSRIEL